MLLVLALRPLAARHRDALRPRLRAPAAPAARPAGRCRRRARWSPSSALGALIFFNTNVWNEYRTQLDGEKRLAELEKALLPYEKLPQPRITDVKLDVELYPRSARCHERQLR